MQTGIGRAVAHFKTQGEAARRWQVSQSAVSKWLSRGWPSPKYGKLIEETTGVTRRELFEGVGE